MITGKTQIKEVLYMDKGIVQVICGDGVGKTSMALGKGIGAVSYTHLDVYKRQVYNRDQMGYRFRPSGTDQ